MKSAAAVALAALLFLACGKTEEAVVDSAIATIEAPRPTLAEFSGNWDLSTNLEGVEKPVLSKLSGSADSANWTISFNGRENIKLHVLVVGDSLIGESDPYESILRKGVQVSFRTATALTSPTTLQGSLIATYDMPKGEEKVAGITSGTKLP